MDKQQSRSADAPSILLIGKDTGARGEIDAHVHAELPQAVVVGLGSTDRFDPAADGRQFDLCIIADRAPSVCMEAVAWMRRRQSDCPILLVLEIEDETLAAEATRRGVEDYILKTPHYEPRLRALITDLVQSSRHRGEVMDSLETSAQQFHDLVENSAQGVLIQVDGRPVYANPALARILGYDDPEQLLRLESVFQFVDPWDLPRMQRIAGARQAGNDAPVSYVFRARRRDGGLVWLENRVNDVTWNGRRALQCNMVDVSDRQRATNALRLAAKVASRAGEGDFNDTIRAALKWLARGMGCVLAESWMPDRDGGPLEAGPAWCNDRRRFKRFIDASRQHRFKAGEGLPGRVLAGGMPEWIEDVSNASGLFSRSVLANESGLKSACGLPIVVRGRTLAVLCFFMSERLERSQALITALPAAVASLGPVLLQITTERARRASIAQAETLVNRNVDGILVVDDQDQILFANPAAEALFGRDIEELQGMSFGAPSTDRNVAEIEIHNARTGGVRVNEMRVAEIQWNGQAARLVSLTDVTERLETRKALERNQAVLEERVKELRCLYSVSNELARQDIPWNEILENVVDTIPSGWQHPASTRVRLRIEDEEVSSGDFAETDWSLSADVWAGSRVVGRLQVFYKDEKPEQDIGPFFEEEQNLLNDLARRIGQSIASQRYEQELRASRQRFQDFAEAASDWLWEMDENLCFTYFSDRIESVMGHPVDHWLGKSRPELTGEDPDSDSKWRRHQADLDARRPFRDFRYELALPNGSVKYISISGVPVFDERGRFRGYRGSGTDETRAVEARNQAVEFERHLQSVADRLPGVVFQRLRKPDGRVEYPYLSAGIEAILGYSAEEVKADPLLCTDLVHPEDKPRFDVALADSGRTLEPMDCKFRMTTRSGDERWVWHRSRPRRLANGDTLWDCIELDITEQKRVEARVQYLGYHDQLTGVPNRDLFVERVDQVLPIASRNQQPVAVAMLGLKRFKQVNEEFGMAGGDEVLRVAADRFRDCLRPGDTVARLGGDRFLFLLPSVSQDPGTHKPFQRLVEAMEQPFTINQRQILVAFNMGIAVFPEDGDSAEELIQKADTAQAHYSRWGPGYGYTFYSDAMPSSDVSRLALEKELNDAIEAGDQLMAYFQPLYDARSGHLMAVETLARWKHPQRGLVPPSEFIQLAEETGLINALGLKILRQACRYAGDWEEAGYPVTISVNLSARQIRDMELAVSIKGILKETGIEPGRLVLEVTESTLIADLDNAILFMEELVAEGVKFALDDFGVGYSSLSYLGRLPVYALKVDRSFVRDLGEDPRGESTIRAVVALAHALDLHVVAEGVETAEQLEHVKRLDVDSLQGFHLARPMPAEELAALLRRRTLSVGTSRPPDQDPG